MTFLLPELDRQSLPGCYTHQGFSVRIEIVQDTDTGPPWEECEGHGPVSDWRKGGKRPGELSLCQIYNHGGLPSHRYYDFAEACRVALRDGWGPSVPGETPKQQAARTARADYERLRAWCNGDWYYVGVIVTVSRAGVDLAKSSLWGIESDGDEFLHEVAEELISTSLDEAEAKRKGIIYLTPDVASGSYLLIRTIRR